MKKRNSIAGIFALICNIANIIGVTLSVLSFFFRGGQGNMSGAGSHAFVYFTVDSNILCALASLVIIPYDLKIIRESASGISACKSSGGNASARKTSEGVRTGSVPGNGYMVLAQKFKYAATVAVTLTFLVVAVFLGPIIGDYFGMFKGSNFHLHFFGPVLAVLSFCIAENGICMKKRSRLLPLIPAAVYGAVYFVQVVVRTPADGGWVDFYHFNAAGRWYLTIAIIAAAVYLIGFLEFKWNQRNYRS